MKKMLFTLFLVSNFLFNGWGQVTITDVSYTPSDPVQGDTIVIIAEITFNHSDCYLNEILPIAFDSTISFLASHCTGSLPTICEAIDTFEFVLDSAWHYTFIIEIFESYDTLCNPYPEPSAFTFVYINIEESVDVSSITEEFLMEYSIFPNPAGDEIRIELGPYKQFVSSIDLYSIEGKYIKTLPNQETIKVNLSNGVYLLHPRSSDPRRNYPIKRLVVRN